MSLAPPSGAWARPACGSLRQVLGPGYCLLAHAAAESCLLCAAVGPAHPEAASLLSTPNEGPLADGIASAAPAAPEAMVPIQVLVVVSIWLASALYSPGFHSSGSPLDQGPDASSAESKPPHSQSGAGQGAANQSWGAALVAVASSWISTGSGGQHGQPVAAAAMHSSSAASHMAQPAPAAPTHLSPQTGFVLWGFILFRDSL